MEKRESIVLAGLELLASKGVHNTPMSAVAKAARTGMGTIYNYFPNKEALINQIYVSIKREERAIFKSFNPNQPIKTQFETYLSLAIDFFIKKPMYFKFMEQLQASPIITDHSKAEGMKAIEAVVSLLEKGQQERIIKDVAISELLTFIGGAILSYLRWYVMEESDQNPSINNLKCMVWDAIKE